MRTRYTLINMVANVGGQLMNLVLLFISNEKQAKSAASA